MGMWGSLGATMYSQIERGIQILTRLGLTQYQAKVFLALDQSGVTNATYISMASGVPREKVYGVLQSLMSLGLVNKVLTSPTTYRALRLDQAVALLTDVKQKNLKELSSEIRVLVKDYNANLVERSVAEGPSVFEQLLGKQAILHQIMESIKKAEVSIDAVIAWKTHLYIPQFVDPLKKVNRKGVEIRLVLQLPQESNALEAFLRKNALSFCKCIVSRVPTVFLQIYDKKKALIFTRSNNDSKEASAIFTNNSSFIEITNTYFTSIWQTHQSPKDQDYLI
jgi:sugar-specific transcriptional regulator TrmB